MGNVCTNNDNISRETDPQFISFKENGQESPRKRRSGLQGTDSTTDSNEGGNQEITFGPPTSNQKTPQSQTNIIGKQAITDPISGEIKSGGQILPQQPMKQKTNIISPKKFLSQKSMVRHTPGPMAVPIESKMFFNYSTMAEESLNLNEIDNVKTQEQKEIRSKLNLSAGMMLFKAGKLEVSSENPIMGPYKYSNQSCFFTGETGLSSTFVGQYYRGLRKGIGHEIYENGSGFHGNFIDDEKSGRGRVVSKDGEYYHGDFKEGLPDGLGTLFLNQTGIKYEGGFVEGKKSGLGTETSKDGTSYEGDWLNGLRHGKGKAVYKDGSSYKGQFKNGLSEGEGILIK